MSRRIGLAGCCVVWNMRQVVPSSHSNDYIALRWAEINISQKGACSVACHDIDASCQSGKSLARRPLLGGMAGGLVLAFQALMHGQPIAAAERRKVRVKVELVSGGRLSVEGWTYGGSSTCQQKLATTLTTEEDVAFFNPGASELALWIEECILIKMEAVEQGLPLVALRHGGTFKEAGCWGGGKTIFERKKFFIEESAEKVIDRNPRIFSVWIEREANINEDLLFRVRMGKS